MKDFFNFLKFSILFYLTAVLLLITYSLSFYISDIVNIFYSPLKISFIFVYSIFLSIYITLHVLYNVKKGKIFCFFSILFSLFYLHEIERNMFLSKLEYSNIAILLFVLYLIAGTTSIILIITADLLQIIKAAQQNSKIRKPKIHEVNEEINEDYFV